MDPITQQTTLAAAGGKKDPLYVDDVFSTFLFKGTRSTLQITNGIDLAGEGGMVWSKVRDSANNYGTIYDTENGTGPQGGRFFNAPMGTNGTSTQSDGLTSFNSDGYTLGGNLFENSNDSTYGEDHVSWTFRKAPGFFDVVTYTGDGTSGRQIPHSIGSTPGMIIVKCTTHTQEWVVWHRSAGQYEGRLNEASSFGWEYITGATDANFTLTNAGNATNASGRTYVAYIFAHDDASFGTDEDESIIKCGSYTGSGNTNGATIDLGFEPQWVILKPSSGSGHWQVYDTMRGWTDGGKDRLLYANLNGTEDGTNTDLIKRFSTGFQLTANFTGNSSGVTYIYMAIRRPNKPPSAGTEVFNAKLRTGTGTTGQIDSGIGFAPDLAIIKSRNVGTSGFFYDRLRGDDNYLQSSSIDQESSGGLSLTSATGTVVIGGSAGWHSENGRTFVDLYFKRAPGFMDIVAYTGTGVIRTVAHNLEAVPELIIVKKRDTANADWPVYSVAAGSNSKAFLNLNDATTVTSDAYWGSTTPTSSVFTVGAGTLTNGGGADFIAYLFATLPGISKVGTYTGTGSTINVNCGFTAGARFVLTKRTDFATDWVFYDTARGIVSGNDPALTLNANDADYTTYDFIDPLNSGFTLNASGFSNQSGGNYIFLAIA